MAKKATSSDVNKSAEIRKYVSENPTAKPAEVAAELTKRGIEVNAGYVSSIKTADKASRKKSKRKGRRKLPKQNTSPTQDVMHAGELMIQAVDLVMKAGYKEAKSLVDVAGRMVNKIRG